MKGQYDVASIEKWDKESIIHVTNLASSIADFFSKENTISVIDIGSNTGKFLELLDRKKEVKNALLIEPEKSFLDFSKNKFKERGFTFLLNAALYDKRCEMFWSRASGEQNNLGISGVTNNTNDEKINLIAFDDLEFTKFEPDLIKIDAEGCDFKIILGMLDFLKKLRRKPLIVAETNGWASISPETAIDILKIQNVLECLNYTFDTVPEWSTDLFLYQKPSNSMIN